jgi:hypothetical protein
MFPPLRALILMFVATLFSEVSPGFAMDESCESSAGKRKPTVKPKISEYERVFEAYTTLTETKVRSSKARNAKTEVAMSPALQRLAMAKLLMNSGDLKKFLGADRLALIKWRLFQKKEPIQTARELQIYSEKLSTQDPSTLIASFYKGAGLDASMIRSHLKVIQDQEKVLQSLEVLAPYELQLPDLRVLAQSLSGITETKLQLLKGILRKSASDVESGSAAVMDHGLDRLRLLIELLKSEKALPGLEFVDQRALWRVVQEIPAARIYPRGEWNGIYRNPGESVEEVLRRLSGEAAFVGRLLPNAVLMESIFDAGRTIQENEWRALQQFFNTIYAVSQLQSNDPILRMARLMYP